MNHTEHLLTILGEEASEVVKDVCKAIRFGLADKEPGQGDDNKRRLEREVSQLVAVAKLLGLEIRDEDKREKLQKVRKYMEISKRNGTLKAEEVRRLCPHCGEFVPPGFYVCAGNSSHPAVGADIHCQHNTLRVGGICDDCGFPV